MDAPAFTAYELLRELKAFCRDGGCGALRSACTNPSCRLRRYLQSPQQISLFDASYKAHWITAVADLADSLESPFWWSELRAAASASAGPAHPNWWGTVTRKLTARGYIRAPECRRSRIQSRRKSDEYRWYRNPQPQGLTHAQ